MSLMKTVAKMAVGFAMAKGMDAMQKNGGLGDMLGGLTGGGADYSFECVGFIVTFNRGTEWAATGKVTQTDIPADFPSVNKVSQRAFERK